MITYLAGTDACQHQRQSSQNGNRANMELGALKRSDYGSWTCRWVVTLLCPYVSYIMQLSEEFQEVLIGFFKVSTVISWI